MRPERSCGGSGAVAGGGDGGVVWSETLSLSVSGFSASHCWKIWLSSVSVLKRRMP